MWNNLCEHYVPLCYDILSDFWFDFMYLCITQVFDMSTCYNQKKILFVIWSFKCRIAALGIMNGNKKSSIISTQIESKEHT